MCRLRNIAMRDYQEGVTTGQTHGQTEGQTDAGQSDPYVPLCFAGDTKCDYRMDRQPDKLFPLCCLAECKRHLLKELESYQHSFRPFT